MSHFIAQWTPIVRGEMRGANAYVKAFAVTEPPYHYFNGGETPCLRTLFI